MVPGFTPRRSRSRRRISARSGSSTRARGRRRATRARRGGARPRGGAELPARRLSLAARRSSSVEPAASSGRADGPARSTSGSPRAGVSLTTGATRSSWSAPGYDGLLTSDSTRVPGLVSIVDVAPTALGQEDGLGSQPAAETRRRRSVDLDERIDENNEVRLPATILVCALVLVLALFAPRAAVPGLAAALLANLALGIAGVSSFWVVLAVLAVAVAVAGPILDGGAPIGARPGLVSRRRARRVPARTRDRRDDGGALPVRPEPELPLLRPLEPPRDDAARARARGCRPPLRRARVGRLCGNGAARLRHGGR